MKIGYIRISSADQNTARQEVLMQELGVEHVYIDRMSGKNTDRPELKRMMNYVRDGVFPFLLGLPLINKMLIAMLLYTFFPIS